MANRSLAQYQTKRDFRKTSEPKGKKKKTKNNSIFVIQKHDASRLHYDFRLEVGGVLVSWAIPKGPSTKPDEKRLAIMTEDHPYNYRDFEGIIPEGEYGAGTVMVWDNGMYRNLKKDKEGKLIPMKKCIKEGLVKVWLNGKKLKGGFALVRTKRGEGKDWLFFKMQDEHADKRRNPTKTENKSVKTGRTMHQIKMDAKKKK